MADRGNGWRALQSAPARLYEALTSSSEQSEGVRQSGRLQAPEWERDGIKEGGRTSQEGQARSRPYRGWEDTLTGRSTGSLSSAPPWQQRCRRSRAGDGPQLTAFPKGFSLGEPIQRGIALLLFCFLWFSHVLAVKLSFPPVQIVRPAGALGQLWWFHTGQTSGCPDSKQWPPLPTALPDGALPGLPCFPHHRHLEDFAGEPGTDGMGLGAAPAPPPQAAQQPKTGWDCSRGWGNCITAWRGHCCNQLGTTRAYPCPAETETADRCQPHRRRSSPYRDGGSGGRLGLPLCPQLQSSLALPLVSYLTKVCLFNYRLFIYLKFTKELLQFARQQQGMPSFAHLQNHLPCTFPTG